jgi:NADH-quinone oxidoreductase subunit K
LDRYELARGSRLIARIAKLVMDSLLHITTLHYLVLGAALFLLGVIGVLTRRNVVVVLMSIELILNAVNLNLVALSRYWQGMPLRMGGGPLALHGQVFSIFVITDAAAEAAVGLGILIAFFRNKETVNVDEVNLLKW